VFSARRRIFMTDAIIGQSRPRVASAWRDGVEATSGIEPEYTVLQFAGRCPA
jgi:hypothetical protein